MNPSRDRKNLLLILWIFTILNYIFADFFMLVFSPFSYQRIGASTSSAMTLSFAILMEALIAMVLLSWILPDRGSRWANVIAGLFGTIWVASTLRGDPPAFYLFFALVEIGTTLFIAGYAWSWRPEKPSG
jgi:hypothetical protein